MSAPFVTALRASGVPVRLASTGAPVLTLRVQMAERWDTIVVEAEPATTVAAVKAAALAAFGLDALAPDAVVAKLRGHELRVEQQSLDAAGARDGSTLLLHHRRRRPVR